MMVPMTDSVTGSSVYVNPAYVISVRPDPADLEHTSIIKLRNVESLRVVGEHREVAVTLSRTM